MKATKSSLFHRIFLVTVLAYLLDGRVTAQTFRNMHTFSALIGTNGYYGTNVDGAQPYAGVTFWDSTLYGAANEGGTNGNGTIFAVNANGTNYIVLYTFSAAIGPKYTNSDGVSPEADLILSGNAIYGTTYKGGTRGCGTVFAVNKNGTGFTNLHSFTPLSTSTYTNSDGANPYSSLALSGNTLDGSANLYARRCSDRNWTQALRGINRIEAQPFGEREYEEIQGLNFFHE